MIDPLRRFGLSVLLGAAWLMLGQASVGHTRVDELFEIVSPVQAQPAYAYASRHGLGLPKMADARDQPPPLPIDRYVLGPGDKLKVHFYERADLSGDFTIRPDGRLGLPLLGIFQAGGKDTNELEEDITAAYVAITGNKPQLLIDIIERRPYFVAGLVDKPGPYPYMPNMTVLHAISIAGGVLRAAAADTPFSQVLSVNRDIGKLRQAEALLCRLVARMARLTAERAGGEDLKAPQRLISLAGKAEAEALIANERRLMKQRSESVIQRKKSFQDSIAQIQDEVHGLEGQVTQTREQARLSNLQLADLDTLRDRGLARRPQMLQLQALAAGYEAKAMEISAAIARAQRTIEDIQRNILSLDLDRSTQIEQEIVETEKQMVNAELEIEATRKLIEQMSGLPVDLATAGVEAEMLYTIVRREQDGYVYIEANETTAIQPGDILRVNFKPSGAGRATLRNSSEVTPSARQ